MTDATLEFLKRLEDPDEWDITRNVPVFTVHSRKSPEGDERYRVTEETLGDIGDNGESRESKKGVLGILTIGHRPNDKRIPETEVPKFAKPIGVFKNQRKGVFGPKQEPCLLVDEYILKEHTKEAKQFPFRSAEYWPNRKEVTGVALLLRDPELDLGMVGYEMMVAYMREHGAPGSDNNARGSDMADPAAPVERTPPAAPAAPAGPPGVQPDHWEQFQRCMKYAAAMGATNGGMPATTIPAEPQVAPTAPATPKEPTEEEAYRRRGEPDLFARVNALVNERISAENATRDKQLAELRDENRQQRDKAKRAELEVVASSLDNAGYQYDRQDFIDRCMVLDEKGVEANVKRVMAYSRTDPARRIPYSRDPLNFTADPPGSMNTFGATDPLKSAPRNHEEIVAYMRQHPGMTYEQAEMARKSA